MAVARKLTKIDPARFRQRLAEWEGLALGDHVRVKGRHGEFIFRGAVLKRDSAEVDHIELTPCKKAQFTAVRPELVVLPTKPALKRQRATR
jgi:hypothetical protein